MSEQLGATVSRGIVSVAQPEAAVISPSAPRGETWRYQIAMPFQVAPRMAAFYCNIRKAYAPGVDFETGMDVILFDNLYHIGEGNAIRLTRNHEERNPNTVPPNANSVMVKYPARGGFVPLGAKRSDGSPHPHAGTGFAILQAFAWPHPHRAMPPYQCYRGSEMYAYFELFQLAYDGATVHIVDSERISFTDLLPGWHTLDGAMTNGIPDGDDLLVTMAGGRAEGRHSDAMPGMVTRPNELGGVVRGTGVMRWRYGSHAWRPADFLPVSSDDHSFEPSLIRDVDGSLLFSTRGSRDSDRSDIRVLRSKDGGVGWRKIIHVPDVVSGTPKTINRAADGTPYIAANLLGWHRDMLCLWPLNGERTGLQTPIVARFGHLEFGPAPSGLVWEIDHPSAMTVRLSDGEWHNVLGYRILDRAEKTDPSAGPTPHTGSYLAEVVSAGPAIPIWNFLDSIVAPSRLN